MIGIASTGNRSSSISEAMSVAAKASGESRHSCPPEGSMGPKSSKMVIAWWSALLGINLHVAVAGAENRVIDQGKVRPHLRHSTLHAADLRLPGSSPI